MIPDIRDEQEHADVAAILVGYRQDNYLSP
jgi:hypothetical protein